MLTRVIIRTGSTSPKNWPIWTSERTYENYSFMWLLAYSITEAGAKRLNSTCEIYSSWLDMSRKPPSSRITQSTCWGVKTAIHQKLRVKAASDKRLQRSKQHEAVSALPYHSWGTRRSHPCTAERKLCEERTENSWNKPFTTTIGASQFISALRQQNQPI